MEQTGFHHSHLEGKVVWGHQVQATVVQSSNTSLIHSIDLYDKTKTNPDGTVYTKIDHVCDMAAALPLPPYGGYALVDSWFTCTRVIDSYAAAGYHLIGGLKTNRIIYPQGIRISIQDFAAHIRKEDVRLVTVNETSYWTYRYEGALNDIKNAVVLLCWPEQAFGEPKALRAFLCTDVSLNTETISTYYRRPQEYRMEMADRSIWWYGEEYMDGWCNSNSKRSSAPNPKRKGCPSVALDFGTSPYYITY